MNKIFYAILTMASAMIFSTGCNPASDDDGNTPDPITAYRCNGNLMASLAISAGGTEYTSASGQAATGGVAIVKQNGTDQTRLDMGLITATGAVCNIKVVMGSIVTPGTYTVTDEKDPVLIISNTGYPVKSVTVTFDELTNPRDNSISPDVDFYDKASGTFSGIYENEQGDDATFSGTFCSDMEPR